MKAWTSGDVRQNILGVKLEYEYICSSVVMRRRVVSNIVSDKLLFVVYKNRFV